MMPFWNFPVFWHLELQNDLLLAFWGFISFFNSSDVVRMSLTFWKTPVSAEICQFMVIFVIFQDFGITSLTRNLMRNWPPMTVKCIWSHVKLSGSCHEDFLGLWRTPKWPRLQNYWDGIKWCHFVGNGLKMGKG